MNKAAGKQNTFDDHWNDHFSNTIPASKFVATQEFFSHINDLFITAQNLNILDAGCGDGVHATWLVNAVSNADSTKLNLVDISTSALIKTRANIAGARYVCSDATMLAYKDDMFDIAYSFGALNYMSDPFQALSELHRVTKSGGVIGVWIFPQKSGAEGIMFRLIRRFASLLGVKGKKALSYWLAPFLWIVKTQSGVNLSNATWKQCAEVILITVGQELWLPDEAQVLDWFNRHSIVVIATDPGRPITIWGKKQ